jgi:hypothetical protein
VKRLVARAFTARAGLFRAVKAFVADLSLSRGIRYRM